MNVGLIAEISKGIRNKVKVNRLVRLKYFKVG